MLDKITLSINAMSDVQDIVASVLRNGYTVTVKPIYEAYWKQKLDHFDIIIEKNEKVIK